MIAALADRVHFPAAMLLLVVGLGVAAGARDLMKRLLGAVAAAMVGVAHLLLLAPETDGGAGLAAVVLVCAAAALGAVLCVRLHEGFGALDGGAIVQGLDADADLSERETG